MTTSSPIAPAAAASSRPESAPLGRRVAAYAIDAVIGGALIAVALIGGGIVGAGVAAGTATSAAVGSAALGVSAVLLLVPLAWAVVYTALQGAAGSPGQRLAGVGLVDAATGDRIGFARALVRNVIWFLACSIVVGYFTPLLDAGPARQGWHDKVGRAVVASRRVADATAVASPAAPPAREAEPNPFLAASASPFVAARATNEAATPLRPVPSSRPPAVETTGLIVSVPGVSHAPHDPADAQPTAPPAVEGPPSQPSSDAPAAPPAPPAQSEPPRRSEPPAQSEPRAVAEPVEEVDATRAAAPRALAQLVWDDGTHLAVYGRTLVGRNPARVEGAVVVPVRDETLSLSKTHFEIGGGPDGAWIRDLHSTNGTAIVRGGLRETLIPDAATPLRAGDRIEFGDRGAEVVSA